jgi:regulator of nonsense transcripts 1
MKGELKIELMHPPPPEMEAMDWNLYNAGIIGEYGTLATPFMR